MTLISCCFLLFLLLFIESVSSIQNTFQPSSSPPVCSYPYSCVPTSECAERHAGRIVDEVLFRCEGKKTVCCPPTRTNFSSVSLGPGVSNAYSTTERNTFNEAKRPESVTVPEFPVKKEINAQIPQENAANPGPMRPHNHGVQVNQSMQSANARPPQSRPSEPKRPLPVQPLEGRRPQPQVPRPQNLPQVPLSLSSHRNFRLLPTESECGVSSFANRITEGEEVSLGEYPWMVLTGLKDKYGNYRWNCGGTLINKWYVLTAAHCVVVDNRTIEYVRLGEHSLTNETDCFQEVCLEPPEDIAIAEIIPHERWNTTTIKNDIALLRLSRNPLKLGKSNINPICLPLNREKLNITSSTKYEVAGWGKTDWNADEGSDVLRKAFISGVSREECNICKDKKKQQYCPITDTQLCIQGWKSVDVCKGDSGGPLMVTRLNIYQIGITSFKGSEYCGAENIPSIFTKVESYLPWILDNIRE